MTSQLLRVFRAVETDGTWLTSSEVATAAGVAARTARTHLSRLVDAKIVVESAVYPRRYRLGLGGDHDLELLAGLRAAAEVFAGVSR